MDAKRHLGRRAALNSFNPRARDGREFKVNPEWLATGVSIHAPVMDAKTRHY